MEPQRRPLLGIFRSPALADFDSRAVLSLAFISMAMNVLLFAMPLYSLQIYDRVLTSSSSDTLVLLTIIVLLALTTWAVLDSVRGRLLLRIGNRYALSLSPKLVDASIARSLQSAVPNGQALRDMQTVQNYIAGQRGIVMLFDLPLVAIFLVVVYLTHAGLGHAMLLGICVMLILTGMTEALTGEHLREAGQSFILANRRIDSVIQNAEAVEAMGMRERMRAYWSKAQCEAMHQSSIAGDRSTAVSAVAKWTRHLLNLLMTALGAWYVINNEITLGGMVAANILAARGLAPLETLIGAWKGLVGARVATERMNLMLEQFSRAESNIQLPAPKGALSIERVVFAHPGTDQPIIKGATFQVPAGAWLGLVGPSAAGKTTLAKLICGVLKPRSGVVRLDGADVYAWNRTDFGRYCGYLPQDVELFAGTVKENIARFSDMQEVEDATVIAAAQMADAHEMILHLPQGYDTPIGHGGAALSAGQRQRIGLARALLGTPRLVVLDEPNSNLDADGEEALQNALQRIKSAGATIVMISHRPSLMSGADYLGVLIEGQLQHFGPREEVLAKLQPKRLHRKLSEVPLGAA